MNKRGKLVRLEKRDEDPEPVHRITQDNENAQDVEDKEVYHVMTNSKYVANIAFDKETDTDRKNR